MKNRMNKYLAIIMALIMLIDMVPSNVLQALAEETVVEQVEELAPVIDDANFYVEEPTAAPVTEAPATEVPATPVPVTEAPATEVPATPVPVTEAPATEVPATPVPVTEAPATEVPATPVPVTEAPATEVPATPVPVTEAPATEVPVTAVPVTEAPATEVPATPVPVTEAPATEVPATPVPVTEAPATEVPATPVPVTEAPATEVPATPVPATEIPAPEASATEAPAEFVPYYIEIEEKTPIYKNEKLWDDHKYLEDVVVCVMDDAFEKALKVSFAVMKDGEPTFETGYIKKANYKTVTNYTGETVERKPGLWLPVADYVLEAPAKPTEAPAIEATEAPAVEATEAPAVEATEAPAVEATEVPAIEATEAPAVEATEVPAVEATEAPAVEATEVPAIEATEAPAVEATEVPAVEATEAPAVEATEVPAIEATEAPAVEATEAPAIEATEVPAIDPTEAPEEDGVETINRWGISTHRGETNIRRKMSKNSMSMGVLPRSGTHIWIINKQPTEGRYAWYQVLFNDEVGYVREDLIAPLTQEESDAYQATLDAYRTPEPTLAPEMTEIPEPTLAPEMTEIPEPTEAPEPTEIPEATEAPEPTEIPEPTETPEATEAPEATEVPEPTEIPESTEAPEPTQAPDVFDDPENTIVPEATEGTIDVDILVEDGSALDDELLMGSQMLMMGGALMDEEWLASLSEEELELLMMQMGFSGMLATMDLPPEDDPPVTYHKLTITSIDYKGETIDGVNWRDVLRPTVFNGEVCLEAHYTVEDASGDIQPLSIKKIANEASPNDADFHRDTVHDGEGCGTIDVLNIPSHLYIGGELMKIDYYDVYIVWENDETSYKNTNIIKVTPSGQGTSTYGSIDLEPITQEVKLKATTNLESTTDKFTMQLTFENNSGKTMTSSKTKSVTVTANATESVTVPVGLKLTASQDDKTGYKLSGTYDVSDLRDQDGKPVVDDEGKPVTAVTGPVVTYTTEGAETTIASRNVAQNLIYTIDVTWIDGPRAQHTELNNGNFVLKFSTDGEKWMELDETQLETLGITALPTLTKANEEGTKYEYSGLPSADAAGSPLLYQVERGDSVPAGYVAIGPEETGDNKSAITYSKETAFTATIKWLDDNNAYGSRPNAIGDLYLKRSTGDGNYEAVPGVPGPLTKDYIQQNTDGTWTVRVPNLPMYSADTGNAEYDYVLVHESDTMPAKQTGETPDPNDVYAHYYDNGSGIHATDSVRCHNGGVIKELHKNKEVYTAEKVWLDSSAADRPTATVSLWRYTVQDASNPGTVDSNFANASQVIFTDGSKEWMLSYDLTGATSEKLDFTEALKNHDLPLYDAQGKKYVYFVRENLQKLDNYRTVYYDANNVVLTQGAPEGGKIRNVYREKAEINVNVQWKCPSKLELIEGTKVRVTMEVKDSEGKPQTLTVYSDVPKSYEELNDTDAEKAQTVGGFDSEITSLDLKFYVNIYDDYGKPFDLKDGAVIREVNILDEYDKVLSYWQDDDKTQYMMNGELFQTSYAYKGMETVDGMKQFYYTALNTITGTRDYTLNKKWGALLLADPTSKEVYNTINSISFKLERISTKGEEGADWEQYPKDAPDNRWYVQRPESDEERKTDLWTTVLNNLPKYDDEGYEYRYRATEAKFYESDNATGTPVTVDKDLKWYVDHARTESATTANNNISGGSTPQFASFKDWLDNGDIAYHDRLKVSTRMYLRADVLAALEKLGSPSTVTALQLTNAVKALGGETYTPDEMTSDNAWYTRSIGIKEICKQIRHGRTDGGMKKEDEPDEKYTWSYTDYLLLEDQVTDRESVDGTFDVTYKTEDLKTAASAGAAYSLNGKVITNDRQYEVNITNYGADGDTDSNKFYVTNKRVGEVHVTIKKIWNDNNNTDKQRFDSVSFKLYQDDTALEDTIEVKPVPGSTENTWELDYSQTLPLFNKYGVPMTYTIKELGTTELKPTTPESGDDSAAPSSDGQNDGGATPNGDGENGGGTTPNGDDSNGVTMLGDYFSRMETPEVEKNYQNRPDSLHYTFTFTNTITGQTSYAALKDWKDTATGGELRPDLVITVKRYLLGGDKKNADIYSPKKDLVWKEPVENDGYGDYDWMIIADELPKYDENGNKYVYFFEEAMSNEGHNVYGQYEKEDGTRANTEDSAKPSLQLFTNTLTDSMTLSNKKVWSIGSYMTNDDDLPEVTIQLYRTTDPDINSLDSREDADIEELIAEWLEAGRLVLVNQTRLVDDKSSIYFPDVSKYSEAGLTKAVADGLLVEISLDSGEKKYELPKYDETGAPYKYLMHEIVEGTGADDVIRQLYTQQTAAGTLVNTFRTDVNRRIIRVEKDWDTNSRSGAKPHEYPSVTYTLVRYFLGDEEHERGEDAVLKSVKIPAAAFQQAEGHTGSERYCYSSDAKEKIEIWIEGDKVRCYFKDLLIYSPSGRLYGYYVTEKEIKGYSIGYTDEENVATGTDLGADVYLMPQNVFTGKQDTAEIATKNTYKNDQKIEITGRKLWMDYDNSDVFGKLRPDSVKFILYRSTDNEPGQQNAVKKEQVTLLDAYDAQRPYISWETTKEGAASSEWVYTIHNLDKYAPNGRSYTYVLTEDVPRGYENDLTNNEKTLAENGGNSNNVENSFTGSYVVRKNWLDGDDKYHQRPENVTMVLQRRRTDSYTNLPVAGLKNAADMMDSDWHNIEAVNGLPSVTVNDQGVVGVLLNAQEHEVPHTNHNSWTYTFENLPTEYRVEHGDSVTWHEWKYQVEEVKIGKAVVGLNSKKQLTGGAYLVSYDRTAAKTTVRNQLNPTNLTVTKIWDKDDQNNLYHTRPDELTFELQVMVLDENDKPTNKWDVVEVEGKSTFTLTAADNWTKQLDYLPLVVELKNEAGEKTGTYRSARFRAVEQLVDPATPEAGRGNVVGAKNYYNDPKNDNKHDMEEGGAFYSKITNHLLNDTDISVTKTWRCRENAPETWAVFELLYRIKLEDDTAEGDWLCYGYGTDAPVQDLTDLKDHPTGDDCFIHEISNQAPESDLTFTWSHLPKYDRQGNELEYTVVEHPIAGYKTDAVDVKYEQVDGRNLYSYAFTNTEMQDYTVSKTWFNADYAQKGENGEFTAAFKLQRKVGQADWEDVPEADVLTLTTTEICAAIPVTQSWTNLLIKDPETGDQIIYRAVETEINGVPVENATNGAYVVTYKYGDGQTTEPQFGDTVTHAHNRMVYGFVNLTKQGAYLDQDVVTDNGQTLSGVEFTIYDANGNQYVTNVTTDAQGNLANTDGKYGMEQRYLVVGSYKIGESSANGDYSRWSGSVPFTVGVSGEGNTGEHGTAWISTPADTTRVDPATGYIASALDPSTVSTSSDLHAVPDSCTARTQQASVAYNIESRGVFSFTKTGKDANTPLNTTNTAGASQAYFGVYVTKNGTDVQVAGMEGTSGALDTMALSIRNEQGQESYASFSQVMNDAGIPYLRMEGDGQLTLLSGDYKLVELRAPAGYKLDSTPRTLTIPHVDTTPLREDLSNVYAQNNQGYITENVDGVQKKLPDNKLPNQPNVVTIYKRDQFGRRVLLNGELELTAEGGTFITGGNTIKLYQNPNKPSDVATPTDLTPGVFAADTGVSITYDAATASWTLTGVLDIGRTYTLSEPDHSVPANYLKAKPISFTITPEGEMQVEPDANNKPVTDPTSAMGDDILNYYKQDAANNVLVLRDVARFLKTVSLYKHKVDAFDTSIPNISFKLYKTSGLNRDGQQIDKTGEPVSVLKEGVVLTTDAQGRIDLSQATGIDNLITDCKLSMGLDMGTYYFEEIEAGASDTYVLHDKVYFEIKRKDSTSPDPEDQAEVVFTLAANDVTQTDNTGNVSNTPAKAAPKTLDLAKVNSSGTNLAGGVFKLDYVSINGAQTGAKPPVTVYCVSDDQGYVWLSDKNGTLIDEDGKPIDEGEDKVAVDISDKGTYTLTEIKAPAKYMTRTDASGSPVTMLTFAVTDSAITVQSWHTLVQRAEVYADNTKLDVTVKNEETVVYIDKLNDIVSNQKVSSPTDLRGEEISGPKLEIIDSNGTKVGDTLIANGSPLQVTGQLIEGETYILRETDTPDGYMTAADIKFKVDGTIITTGGAAVSRLYVLVNNDHWDEVTNIKRADDNKPVLTMVDEIMVAPVDLHKKVGANDLSGAEFTITLKNAPNTVLGVAKTSGDHLVWEKVASTAPNGLIYDGKKRIDSADDMKGKTVFLRAISGGYTFTETYAPENAFNDGRCFDVTIDTAAYLAYKANPSYRVVIEDTTGSGVVVNQPYKSTVWLHKYDADFEAENASIKGAEFTLYRDANGDREFAENEQYRDKPYTTGEDGKLTIEIPLKGYYKLVETKPADGYTADKDKTSFTFTLKDQSTDEDKQDGIFGYGEENQLAYDATGVPNDRIMGSVIMKKIDNEASEADMDGVVFTLSRTNPGEGKQMTEAVEVTVGKHYEVEQNDSDVWVFTETTGTPGQISIAGLEWDRYTLTETKTKDGYVLDLDKAPSYGFTIGPKAPARLEWTLADAPNTKNRMTLTKQDLQLLADGTHKQLTGAQYQLYAVEDGKVDLSKPVKFYVRETDTIASGQTITVGDNTIIYGLPSGEYLLYELVAPEGYEITADKQVVFTMLPSGALLDKVYTCSLTQDTENVYTVTKTKPGSWAEIDNKALTKEGVYNDQLLVRDQAIEVELTKVLSVNGDVLDGRGDAAYEITGDKFADTTATKLTVTGNDIQDALRAKLIAGKGYTITEITAPAGYEVYHNADHPLTIVVSTDGKVTVKDSDGSLTADNTTGIAKLTLKDDPIELALVKQNEDGGDLTGAVFTVTGEMYNPDIEQIKDNDEVTGVTVDNIGDKLTGRLIGGNTYTFEETKAPDGYFCAPKFTVELNKDGAIKEVLAQDGTAATQASGMNETITVKDKPTVVKFLKVEDDNNPLAGAEFKLEATADFKGGYPFVNPSVDGEGNAITSITWTSGDKAEVFTSRLIAGVTYKLTETGRVANHEQMDGYVLFHVNAATGAVEIEDGSTAYIPNNPGMTAAAVDTTDKVTMTIQNPFIKGSVVLTKYWKDKQSDNLDATNIVPGAIYTLTRVKNEHSEEITGGEPIGATETESGYAYDVDAAEGTQFETNDEGKIIVTGLPEGWYEFQEIAAPKAYHVNTTPVRFEIHNASEAHVTNAQDVDLRINAAIELAKWSENKPLPGAVFQVDYAETAAGPFTKIGVMAEDKNAQGEGTGVYRLTKGNYDTLPGLWRGCYRITELSADGQMLNKLDGTRNVITFTIDDVVGKIYEVKADAGVTYTLSNAFISLQANGVHDTPIPVKDVTVTKTWSGDTGLEKTFQPASVTVELWRTYEGAAEGEFVATKTFGKDSQGNWTCTWEDQDAYKNVDVGDGKQETRLYTYYTVENPVPDWYKFSHAEKTDKTEKYNKDALDGNTTSTVTNTMTTHQLTIEKLMGGGSADDEFQVMVELLNVTGKNYFLDDYTCIKANGDKEPLTPGASGWVTIHGGEKLIIRLPEEVEYRVIERQDSSGYAYVTNQTDYYQYKTRYLDNTDEATAEIHTMGTADKQERIRNAVVKHLTVVKQSESGASLSGAAYRVDYRPLNSTAITPYSDCVVNPDNVLCWRGEPLDLTAQGTYTLYETKAPSGYMHPSDTNGDPAPLATVTVTAEDEMTVQTEDASLVYIEAQKDMSEAYATVKNRETKVSIGKLNDICASGESQNMKTWSQTTNLTGEPLSGVKLTILKREGETETWVTDWTTTKDLKTLTGVLVEDTEYILREDEATVPEGCMKADDVIFKIIGTATTDSGIVSQLYVWNGTGWSKANNIKDNNLYMVDEVVISPVDLTKVVGDGNKPLPGAKFTVKHGDTKLGTAITNGQGHLVWERVEAAGVSSGLIFNSAGKRITSADHVLKPSADRIILRKDAQPYTFTEVEESDSPDIAYNTEGTYSVTVEDKDYVNETNTAYKNDRTYWKPIQTDKADGTLVNPAFTATFVLYKYDGEQPDNDQSAALTGVEFTLTKLTKNGDVIPQDKQTGVVYKTDDNGVLTLLLSEKGTYKLKETGPLSGYKDAAVDWEFTIVNDDQKKILTYDEANEKHTKLVTTAGDRAQVSNARQHGSITLTKTDKASDKALNNVVYTLTRVAPDDENDPRLYPANSAALTVKTGWKYTLAGNGDDVSKLAEGSPQDCTETTPGVLVIENLQWGTYQLVETTELSGYVRNSDPITLTVGELTADELNSEVQKRLLMRTTEPKNAKNKVTFVKENEDHEKLEGAVFEVHEGKVGDSCDNCKLAYFYLHDNEQDENGNPEGRVTVATTDATGKVTIYGLDTVRTAANSETHYHLVEITAPLGYTLAAPVDFTIDRDGVVKEDGKETDKVTMTDQPIVINIEKVGEALTDTLDGATFQLEDACPDKHALADETDVATETTENGGKASFDTLCIAGHTYSLTETKAPAGYACTVYVKFSVKDDGTVTLLENSGDAPGLGTTVDDTTVTITTSNKMIRASLTKQDMDDPSKTLEGVTFTLTPVGEATFADGTKAAKGFTTDANGVISFPDDDKPLFVYGSSYTLTETSLDSNTGYRLYADEKLRTVTLNVAESGAITLGDGAPTQFSMGEDNHLTVLNEPIRLSVTKLDMATGNLLDGVWLKLTRLDDSETLVDKWETTKDSDTATKVFTGLTPGKYRLEEDETHPREGYNPIIGPLTFTIDQSGRVSTAAAADKTYPDNTTLYNFTIDNPADGMQQGTDGKPVSSVIALTVTNAAHSTLRITKRGSDGSNPPLKGVKFHLVGSDYEDEAITDENGIAVFSDMPDGLYTLTEMQTAAGYNLLSKSLIVKIDRNRGVFRLYYDYDPEHPDDPKTYVPLSQDTDDPNVIDATIINRKGFDLPATGTTTPQLPLGVLLAVALLEAAVLYAYAHSDKRKRRSVNSG